MKKISTGLVLSLALVGLLAFPVAPARAETVTIASLQALIDELKAQIAELQNARNAVQETRKELRLNILRFLAQGATGDDVEALQEYLALDSDIYPEGLITGYYGPLTAAAVRRFQAAHGIDQVGQVGPITTAKLNQLFGDGFLPDGSIPPGLTHAPGILKKEGGVCAVPGIAKRLSSCAGFVPDDDDEDEDDDELEFEDVVATMTDDILILEDDSEFVINDDTEVEDGVEVGSEVEIKYEVDGDDFVALEVKLEDEDDDDEDDEANLTVIKVVVNNASGTSEIEDFELFVGARNVDSGDEEDFDPGDYKVSEDGPDGYTATFSGACDSDGDVTLAAGDDKTCTITNDDN